MVFKSYGANSGAKHFHIELHLLAFIALSGVTIVYIAILSSLLNALFYKVLAINYNSFNNGPYFLFISFIGVLFFTSGISHSHQPSHFKTLTQK